MKAQNGHTAEMAHRCPVRHFLPSAMPGIKKRKKSAQMARHDRGLQDTPDGLAVMVTALPSYTKARRDNRCPLPPLPAGRRLCLLPPFHHSHRTCPPGCEVRRHGRMPPFRLPHQGTRGASRPGAGHSTGKVRPAERPCSSAWTRWLRDADVRKTAGGQAPESAPSPYPPSS